MSEPRVSRRPALLVLLALLLALECAALVAVACYLVIELLVARPDSIATAIALLLLDVLAAIWGGTMAVHTLRGRSWIRSGAMTWQILQIAVGIGSFQAPFSRPDIGWLLILPAVGVIILLFTPSVIAATRRQDEAPVE
ncbi:hypothetical protein F1C58_03290 [Glaciihabitans sp. INWT7]|uniref:hypothetical protein n=1 Tax=Glaciihabitans sp. INWT7 TaxID=2596912 RepID=UPI001624411C|nr:hypothetical protein [Glaciihabitans sp. INWT7]QNE46029.1 hypothetical protein F1C58_03290 [Glaciihabitans sp. INWT7]